LEAKPSEGWKGTKLVLKKEGKRSHNINAGSHGDGTKRLNGKEVKLFGEGKTPGGSRQGPRGKADQAVRSLNKKGKT